SVSSDLTAGTLTLSAGSLTLNGDTTLSSAISNSGTITFGEGVNLALTEVTASVITGLDENTTGLQTVGSTYTIATGGTVSGLTTANVTVNGIGVTSVSDDGLSASISESVYNIGADASVSYSSISAEDLDAAAYINVAGTLDLGAHSSFSMNARGTGTITVSDDSTTGGHATISLGDGFAGTAKLSGEIDVGGLNVGSAKVVFSGTENNLWSYKSETISNDVTFEGATTIHSDFGGDLTFSGDVSWSDGAAFDTNGKTIRFQDGNISIGAGVTVSLSDVNDVLDYDATNTITIEGTLDLSTSRQTFKSGNKLVLVDGGLIKGTNGLSEDGVSEVGDGYGAVDFMGSGNVVTAKGTGNEISANIRFRNSDVTFAVDEGSELTLSGVFNPKVEEVSSANGIVKTGLGVLTLKGNNEGKAFGTTISEGTLVAASTNALGEGDVILGNGSATTGEVTLQVACDATAGVLKLNSSSVSLDLDGALSLTQITVGETSPDSVSIDFGTNGKITTTQELNFGGSVTAFTFTLALTDEELNDLNSGENVSREILLGGGNWGIWNFGDKGTKTISITNWDISNEDYVGVITDTSTLTDGQWGYIYTDTDSQDSVSIYIAGIPEPSAFGLLAGAGALALVVSRRKRRK
ncbi:MAG: PEP-CTERM sorting domain-containing protein, partial [Opitutales bacterium]|nr:PEP-CTERM sorting domain-containing protein [Opitutales bacterium]